MKQTIRFGRISGFPVGVHWSVLIVVVLLAQGLAVVLLPAADPGQPAMLYWLVAAAATVLFIASLLAHELSHALVARRSGIRVERVTLWLLGGVAELGGEPPTPRVDLTVAVAGPLVSLGTGVLFLVAGAGADAVPGLPAVVVAALGWLGWINVLLAVFNLLPAAPLDGGRVLRALLWRRWGDRIRAGTTAARAGRVLGGGLIGLAAVQLVATGSLSGLWWALLGWFLISAAAAEQRDTELTGRLRDLPVRAAMDPRPAVGFTDQSIRDFAGTVARFSRQRAFPVVDRYGHPAGEVRLTALTRVPPARWPGTPLGVVMVRGGAPVDADRRLAEVAPLTAAGAVLSVVDHGVLVGTLDRTDVARALDLTTLGVPVDLHSGS